MTKCMKKKRLFCPSNRRKFKYLLSLVIIIDTSIPSAEVPASSFRLILLLKCPNSHALRSRFDMFLHKVWVSDVFYVVVVHTFDLASKINSILSERFSSRLARLFCQNIYWESKCVFFSQYKSVKIFMDHIFTKYIILFDYVIHWI